MARMTPALMLADWLQDLAVSGSAKRFQDAETAYHLSEAIKHNYLVQLAIRHTPLVLPTLEFQPKISLGPIVSVR